MRVSRFSDEEGSRLVVAHSDVTDRMLAELDAARRAGAMTGRDRTPEPARIRRRRRRLGAFKCP